MAESTNRGIPLVAPVRRAVMTLSAVILVLADYWLVFTKTPRLLPLAVISIGVLAVIYLVSGRKAVSLGLTLKPVRGYSYWVRAALAIGLGVAAFATISSILLGLVGVRLPPIAVPPGLLWQMFVTTCLLTPVIEEVAYRLILCNAAEGILGTWGTIALSGVAFAALHVFSANIGPDNLIAGLVLAWAFLRSRSIVIPIAMHALGNLAVLLWQLGTWYWFFGRGV